MRIDLSIAVTSDMPWLRAITKADAAVAREMQYLAKTSIPLLARHSDLETAP